MTSRRRCGRPSRASATATRRARSSAGPWPSALRSPRSGARRGSRCRSNLGGVSLRRALPLLVAVAVAVALGAFVPDPSLRVALPELVIALALAIWCFGSYERPFLHEAHELGVGPRAVVQ